MKILNKKKTKPAVQELTRVTICSSMLKQSSVYAIPCYSAYSSSYTSICLNFQMAKMPEGKTFGWLLVWNASGIRVNMLSQQGVRQLSRLQSQKMLLCQWSSFIPALLPQKCSCHLFSPVGRMFLKTLPQYIAFQSLPMPL